MKKGNIYLIGPMGSGKTSIGVLLAKKMRIPFYDSDQEIERQLGVSISWIFEVESEQGFRQREKKIIAELTQKKPIVLATGGGSILLPQNREKLANTGTIIYLRVSLKEQLKRTGQRKGVRPLAEGPDREQRLAHISQEREPIYLELADFIYETDDKTPQEIVEQILKNLESDDD